MKEQLKISLVLLFIVLLFFISHELGHYLLIKHYYKDNAKVGFGVWYDNVLMNGLNVKFELENPYLFNEGFNRRIYYGGLWFQLIYTFIATPLIIVFVKDKYDVFTLILALSILNLFILLFYLNPYFKSGTGDFDFLEPISKWG